MAKLIIRDGDKAVAISVEPQRLEPVRIEYGPDAISATIALSIEDVVLLSDALIAGAAAALHSRNQGLN